MRRRELHGSQIARALTTLPAAPLALVRMRRLTLVAAVDRDHRMVETPFVFVTPND